MRNKQWRRKTAPNMAQYGQEKALKRGVEKIYG